MFGENDDVFTTLIPTGANLAAPVAPILPLLRGLLCSFFPTHGFRRAGLGRTIQVVVGKMGHRSQSESPLYPKAGEMGVPSARRIYTGCAFGSRALERPLGE
jgi:hypothetical protein